LYLRIGEGFYNHTRGGEENSIRERNYMNEVYESSHLFGLYVISLKNPPKGKKNLGSGEVLKVKRK